jgi:hypothetical protein
MNVGILIPTRGVVMESARRPPLDACWAMAIPGHLLAGVTDPCVRFIGRDQQAQLERFSAEVLPAFRAARPAAERSAR